MKKKFKVKMAASAAAVATASGVDADTAYRIESAWSNLKGPLLDAATKVCGLSKNHQWESKTRWWNEQVDEVIQEKCTRFKAFRALKKGVMTAEAKGVKLPTLTTSLWQSMTPAWQGLKQRKRYSPQYPLMVMVY